MSVRLKSSTAAELILNPSGSIRCAARTVAQSHFGRADVSETDKGVPDQDDPSPQPGKGRSTRPLLNPREHSLIEAA
jgi:hypothetical protein